MTPTFSPVNIWGIALGALTRSSSCRRLAPIVRRSAIASGSEDASPCTVPTATGKNVNSATSPILGAVPNPNQMTTSGASTMIGSVWEVTISG